MTVHPPPASQPWGREEGGWGDGVVGGQMFFGGDLFTCFDSFGQLGLTIYIHFMIIQYLHLPLSGQGWGRGCGRVGEEVGGHRSGNFCFFRRFTFLDSFGGLGVTIYTLLTII